MRKGAIIEDNRFLMKRGNRSIHHIMREGNMCPHKLAKIGARSEHRPDCFDAIVIQKPNQYIDDNCKSPFTIVKIVSNLS